MVHLILSSTKGNQGLRYFPHTGYLGLTPVRVEGVVRTKLDADLKTCQAKSLTISVRCYETRTGRVSTLQTNILVDYTQVLWSKADDLDYEQIGNLEFPFRINIPARIAGFSTAIFVDYRCIWRVEAVLHHAPLTGVGSRQIRHFELPLVRYDTPLYSPIPPQHLHHHWSNLESHKPRAPRIRYTLNTPTSPIGPLDLISVPIHVQPLDQGVSIRSASISIERRILLSECAPSASSLQAPLSPVTLQSSSSSSSLSKQLAPPSPLHHPSTLEPDLLSSTASLSGSNASTLFASTSTLIPSDTLPLLSSNSPNLLPHTSTKAIVNAITDTESSGYFSVDENGVWSKTLTLQWPAAKSHSRWAIGETISSDLVSVKYFVRTKIVVASATGTDAVELAERELLVVSTNEAERQLALAKYHELEAENHPTRSKSKSPRRTRPDRDREDPIPPSPSVASPHPRSKSTPRRPHTSAGPRDKPVNFAGGIYGRSSRGQENDPLPPSSTTPASSKRRSDLSTLRAFQRAEVARPIPDQLQQQSWPPSSAGGKVNRMSSAASIWAASTHHSAAIPIPSKEPLSLGTPPSSSSLSSSSYGGESEGSTSDHMKEWEEELARIEMKSRRSSDLLGFSRRRKVPVTMSTSSSIDKRQQTLL